MGSGADDDFRVVRGEVVWVGVYRVAGDRDGNIAHDDRR